jgi:hypothetical protein
MRQARQAPVKVRVSRIFCPPCFVDRFGVRCPNAKIEVTIFSEFNFVTVPGKIYSSVMWTRRGYPA